MSEEALTPEESTLVHDAVGWDDRKTLTDIYQDHGGRLTNLDEATYDALLAVARHGAARVARDVAAMLAQARAEALREAADDIDGPCPGVGAALSHPSMAVVRSWLQDRADQAEAQP